MLPPHLEMQGIRLCVPPPAFPVFFSISFVVLFSLAFFSFYPMFSHLGF